MGTGTADGGGVSSSSSTRRPQITSHNSLEPLLPACWGKKPRTITAFSGTWRKASTSASSSKGPTALCGSNPDRLMNQLIAALTASHIHFVRLGEYRLQFVYTPPPPLPHSQQDPASAPSPLESILAATPLGGRVRVAVEVCHVLATSSYVTHFKNLHHQTPPSTDSYPTDFKAVTRSLVRLARSSS